jgi:hypothetical protein
MEPQTRQRSEGRGDGDDAEVETGKRGVAKGSIKKVGGAEPCSKVLREASASEPWAAGDTPSTAGRAGQKAA